MAIVGSRNYPDLEEVRAYVHALPPGTTVVSGGARGVDATAEATAVEAGLPVLIVRPSYEKHGRGAPLVRNREVVKNCDRLVAFTTGSSGTAHTIDCAREAGIDVTVFQPAGA